MRIIFLINFDSNFTTEINLMKRKHDIDPDELNRLKKEVESFIDYQLKTPENFSRLSEKLQKNGCGYISATTLKRIWGYIKDTGNDYKPSVYSMNSLCRLIGFKNIDEFSDAEYPIQSKEYTGEFIESVKLPPNAEIELRWQPNRCCTLRHITATLFKVIDQENSRLNKDDLVECGCFTQHAPVYFTRVFRDGTLPMTYIAGASNGISYKISLPENL